MTLARFQVGRNAEQTVSYLRLIVVALSSVGDPLSRTSGVCQSQSKGWPDLRKGQTRTEGGRALHPYVNVIIDLQVVFQRCVLL